MWLYRIHFSATCKTQYTLEWITLISLRALSVLRLCPRERINNRTAHGIVGWCVVWFWPQTGKVASLQCFPVWAVLLGRVSHLEVQAQPELEVETDMDGSCLTVTLTVQIMETLRETFFIIFCNFPWSDSLNHLPHPGEKVLAGTTVCYREEGLVVGSLGLCSSWLMCQNTSSCFFLGHFVLSKRGRLQDAPPHLLSKYRAHWQKFYLQKFWLMSSSSPTSISSPPIRSKFVKWKGRINSWILKGQNSGACVDRRG